MADESRVPVTLEHVVDLAVATITGCDAAVVMVLDKSGPHAAAGSDPLLLDVVVEHVASGGAPLAHAAEFSQPVVIDDLCIETRWPEFSRRLVALGIGSVYAFPLMSKGHALGALALYCKRPGALDREDRETANLVAMHATAALAGSLAMEQYETALASRTVIGQATGVVMHAFGLDASAAFGVLRRLSQDQNVKLRDIAARVVETGSIE